jgi:hypothetical protein
MAVALLSVIHSAPCFAQSAQKYEFGDSGKLLCFAAKSVTEWEKIKYKIIKDPSDDSVNSAHTVLFQTNTQYFDVTCKKADFSAGPGPAPSGRFTIHADDDSALVRLVLSQPLESKFSVTDLVSPVDQSDPAEWTVNLLCPKQDDPRYGPSEFQYKIVANILQGSFRPEDKLLDDWAKGCGSTSQ